jgi:hypothetical protein
MKLTRNFALPQAVGYLYPPLPIQNPTLTTAGTRDIINSWAKTLSGAAYGNGDYIVTGSSGFWLWGYLAQHQAFLFLRDPAQSIGASWDTPNYDSNGAFMQTRQIARYTLDGSYYGDWVTVKMPEKIQIVRCSFIARSGLVQRAPTKFRLYGSNDGSTWALIHNQAAALPYSGDIGRVDISTQTEYNHFGLVVSELSATGPSNDVLNFLQWDIYAVKVVCLCLR